MDEMVGSEDNEWEAKTWLEYLENLLSVKSERSPALERIDLRLHQAADCWSEGELAEVKRLWAKAGVRCDLHTYDRWLQLRQELGLERSMSIKIVSTSSRKYSQHLPATLLIQSTRFQCRAD